MKTILQWVGMVLAALLAIVLASPPLAAQLNRVSPRQIVCAAGNLLAGGSAGSVCTSTPALTLNALGTTSTDGLSLSNVTPSTAGTTVQISPRMKWCGTAWNSSSSVSETDCLFVEVLPATVAGTTTATMKIGYVNPAGTVSYPVTMNSAGGITASKVTTLTGSTEFTTAAAGFYDWLGRATLTSTADKIVIVSDNAVMTGLELNVGTPALGTCTGGTLVSGSHNFGGRVTGTTGGTCAINFGTPNFTNAPFCFAIDETATGIVNTSGETTATFTISNITSGHAVKYWCAGRIGT